MRTAVECRKLAAQYQAQSDAGVSPKMAAVLRRIAQNFNELADQYETLIAVAEEERSK